MSWLKIDDGLFLHPKWLRTPATARALWITALSYCGKMSTDGHVDSALLPLLGGSVEDADALVASGLWAAVEGGYSFHDFEDYNRTTEQAEALSEARSEAGKVGAAKRWEKQNDGNSIAKNSKPMAKPWQKMPPEPEPVSRTPKEEEDTTAPREDAKPQGKDFDPGLPLPVEVDNFLSVQQNPERWKECLVLELTGRTFTGDVGSYAMSILRRWKQAGGPPKPQDATKPQGGYSRKPTARERVAAATAARGARLVSELAELGTVGGLN